MWQWLAQNSGTLQAIAAIMQVIVAIFIFWITRRYVALTNELAKLQAQLVTIEKDTARRELYDRRVKVYDNTMSFLATFARDLKIEFEDIRGFLRDTREAEFLFEGDVTDYLAEISSKANEYWALRLNQEAFVYNQHNVDRQRELESWLVVGAFSRAKIVFGHYLRLVELIKPPEAT